MVKKKMKVQTRQNQIVTILRECERATVDQLSDQLGISRETVRRDLTELEKQGKIQKFHGGATLPRTFGESGFQHRMRQNVEAKVKISKAAVDLFHDGETLFVDTGSTTVFFAEQLVSRKDMNVITNSMDVAGAMADSNNHALLLGGTYRHDNRQTIGATAAQQIKTYRTQHVVLTLGTLTEFGAADFDQDEAEIAKAMIEQAAEVTVLIDKSKLRSNAPFVICPLENITRVVCDFKPEGALEAALIAAKTKVISV